jgi:hypothetical protein
MNDCFTAAQKAIVGGTQTAHPHSHAMHPEHSVSQVWTLEEMGKQPTRAQVLGPQRLDGQLGLQGAPQTRRVLSTRQPNRVVTLQSGGL